MRSVGDTPRGPLLRRRGGGHASVASAISTSTIATTIATAVSSTAVSTATIAAAVTAALATASPASDALPGELNAHLHTAWMDVHA